MKKDWTANRLGQLPPYLFVEIDRKKRAALAAGKDVINFGIGDPDRPTHEFIIDKLEAEIRDPANHRYPPSRGLLEFRSTCARYLERRFNVRLDPELHIAALIGSKEGIGHLPLAVVNPGDHILVPQPGYPVYKAGTIFAGGTVQTLPLSRDGNWLPDFAQIPVDIARKTKLMYLNYPNNPTGAVASREFFEGAVRFARDNSILIAHDAAYSELYFDAKPPSLLEVEGAVDTAVEFHSLSKSFNMTGWRIAFVAGQPDVVASLAAIKDNLDSGQFGAIQRAAIEALEHFDHIDVQAMRDTYRRRRDLVVESLRNASLDAPCPQAGFYVWGQCPEGYTSMEFSSKVLDDAAVVVIPGNGFGDAGEGFFRIALTVEMERTREAMSRLSEIRW